MKLSSFWAHFSRNQLNPSDLFGKRVWLTPCSHPNGLRFQHLKICQVKPPLSALQSSTYFVPSKIPLLRPTSPEFAHISRSNATMNTKVLSIPTEWFRFPIKSDSDDLKFLNEGPEWIDPRAESILNDAEKVFENEEVVAIPTETVYGLAADARSNLGVSRIFAAKQRPSDNPLIVHIASLDMLKSLIPEGEIPSSHIPLIRRHWPGPLTLLFPVAPGAVSDFVTAGLSTVAIRFPAHPVARALIHRTGRPLAAPSANSSGKPSPTLASHVFRDLQHRIPLILDSGQCDCGLESTVVSLESHHPIVLRPGEITVEQLREIPGLEQIQIHSGSVDGHDAPQAPGMKYRHYSPQVPVHVIFKPTFETLQQEIVKITQRISSTGLIGIYVTQPYPLSWNPMMIPPSLASRLVVFEGQSDPSKELFRGLRWLDEHPGVEHIVVEGIPAEHTGRAFMNRVLKAASTVSSV
jgi:L-threonylcarbamoyladenylate synthase